jgi:hypothetical protein
MDLRKFLVIDPSKMTDEHKAMAQMLIDTYYPTDFPNFDMFIKNTQAGEDIEKLLSDEIFNDLDRVKNENFDHIQKDSKERVESKSIRMMSNDEKDEKFPVQRSMSIFDRKTNLSNTSFQQIKPKEFDQMVGVLLYKDGLEIYKVPSTSFHDRVLPKTGKENKSIVDNLLKEGKIVLSGQHKGNLEEGQIGFNQLEKYLKFSIYIKNGKYYYIENGQKTDKEFTKLNFSDL